MGHKERFLPPRLSGGYEARLGDLRQVIRQRARCADSGRSRDGYRKVHPEPPFLDARRVIAPCLWPGIDCPVIRPQ